MSIAQAAPSVWGFYPGQHDGAGGDFGTTDRFINARMIGIGWPSTGNLEVFVGRNNAMPGLEQRLLEIYRHEPRIASLSQADRDTWSRRSAGIINRFLNEAKQGDIVVYACKADEQVHTGKISNTANGRYFYDGATAVNLRLHWHFHHFRAVDWLSAVPYSQCTDEELRQVRTQNTFWRMKSCPERFMAEPSR